MAVSKNWRQTVATLALILGTLSLAAPISAEAAGQTYKRNNYAVRDLAPERQPYFSAYPGPLDGTGTYDADGVSVRIIGGKNYDHPVLQAQFMLTRLSSYGYNRNPAYLERIGAHAKRLMDTGVMSRGAMYLPYPFDWALHGDQADIMTAPWYSAMAQGQALSAFVRLYRATGKAEYKATADLLFASFRNFPVDSAPWTVNIDGDGYLWFEEYAKEPGADRSFNGHVFATYGLYDYYQLTHSAEAKSLFQAGVTAVEGHMPEIREPGWISHYSLANREYAYASYHSVHSSQLFQLYTLTGAASLAKWGDLLLADYPAAQFGGRGYLEKGHHDALKISSDGTVISSMSFTLPVAQAVTVGSRARLRGRDGVWLRVDTGAIAGCWVREIANRSFIKLATETYVFDPIRLVRFVKGTFTGEKFNTLGLRSASKTFTLTAASAAHASERTVMNGVLYYRITNGVWAGYAISARDGVTIG